MTIRTVLLAQLEAATEHLLYVSDSACPLQPFMFRVSEDRVFGVEQLLQTLGLLQPQNWDEYLGDLLGLSGVAPTMQDAFQKIKQVLQANLVQVQVYRMGQQTLGDAGWADRGTVVFPLLLGQSPSGDWLGLCPQFIADANASAERIRPTVDRLLMQGAEPVQLSTLKLISELKVSILDGPLIIQADNSWECVDKFFWKAAATKDGLMHELLQSTGFLKIFPFQGFSNSGVDGYRPAQLSHDQRSLSQRFAMLDQLLRDNLTDIREYIIGGYTNFYIAAIGQTVEGDWVGVSTQAVWL